MPQVAETTAYYLSRQLSVVALVSKGLRLPKGPWLWVADGAVSAWQVEKILLDASRYCRTRPLPSSHFRARLK